MQQINFLIGLFFQLNDCIKSDKLTVKCAVQIVTVQKKDGIVKTGPRHDAGCFTAYVTSSSTGRPLHAGRATARIKSTVKPEVMYEHAHAAKKVQRLSEAGGGGGDVVVM